MSGLSRTPGKRVWVNSPPRVRIPPAPPKQKSLHSVQAFFRLSLSSAATCRAWNEALPREGQKISEPQRFVTARHLCR